MTDTTIKLGVREAKIDGIERTLMEDGAQGEIVLFIDNSTLNRFRRKIKSRDNNKC